MRLNKFEFVNTGTTFISTLHFTPQCNDAHIRWGNSSSARIQPQQSFASISNKLLPCVAWGWYMAINYKCSPIGSIQNQLTVLTYVVNSS